MRTWTDEEENRLRNIKGSTKEELFKAFPKRTWSAIRGKAKRLKIRKLVKLIPWNIGLTQEEDPRVLAYSLKNPLHVPGWHHTDEAKEKIRQTNIRNKAHLRFHTPEARAKAEQTMKEKYGTNRPCHSEEAQRKRSDSLKRYYQEYPEVKKKKSERFIKDVIESGKHNDGLPSDFKLSIESIEKIKNSVVKNYFINPEIKEKIRRKRLNQVFPTRDTSIEVKMQNALRLSGINFCTHFPFFRKGFGTQMDIALPERRIAIYCDGDYWHNLLEYKKRDERANKTLEKHGWTVLRFWEHEINEDINLCIESVKEVIELK